MLNSALLPACSGQPIQRKNGSSSLRSFSVKVLAKGDVDNVVGIHPQEIIEDKRKRALRFGVTNAAGMIFLPI